MRLVEPVKSRYASLPVEFFELSCSLDCTMDNDDYGDKADARVVR